MKRKYIRFLWPLMALLLNLGLAYAVYFVARMAFYVENHSLYSDMTARHFTELLRGGVTFDTSAILYTNSLWILMVLLPLHLKETPGYHRVCRWLFVVMNVLMLVLNLCDSVYFRYSMRRTTTTIFQEFENENNLGGIFLTETLSHWYFFLLVAFVGWALWKLYVDYPSSIFHRSSSTIAYYATMTLSLLAFLPFCVAGMRGGWTRDIRPITISNANNYCDHATEAALVLNTPFTLLRTIHKNNFEVVAYYATREELESVYNPVHIPHPQHPFRRKNVVVIIVESFGREYIGAYNRHISGYKGFTSFTDSLIERGGALTWRHSYCNGRKSIDAMPSILSSIPMFVEPFFLSPYSVNDISGLADCLNRKGYQTAFFHGAERGSMGFMAFARATKFQEYFGREDFVADPRTRGDEDYDGWWGISDEPFMQYYCQKMSEMREPFMTTLFTLSSHHPFRVPEPYQKVFKEENPKMPIYKVIRYTDMALQHFFNSARQQPWFQNTIFVITGDHTNQSNIAEYRTDLGGFASPVIFYDPSGEMGSGMQDAIAQQIDIMPTMLEYLGYDQPYIAFGKDLFSTSADSTWAVNYLDGMYQYVKYGHVLQFDGEKSRAVYSLDDRLMEHNLIGRLPQQENMERELKAIIQQYMERMTENRLIPQP